MAALTLRHALAAPFAISGETFDIALQTAASTHTVTIAAVATAYMLLGSPTTDAIRVLQTALNAPSPALPGGVSFTVAMNASGKVVITVAGDAGFRATTFASTSIGAQLGWTAHISSYTASSTANEQPKYIALFVECAGLLWQPIGQNCYSESAGGVSYGYQSAVLSWVARDVRFGFIPRDPSFIDANTQQTPWHPADANLANIGNHAVPWGLADLLRNAGAKVCRFAHQNLQTLLTSTSAYFYNCAVAGQDLAAPRIERQTGAWDKYLRWTVTLLRQSAGTRA